MTGPWLPRCRFGEASNSLVTDDGAELATEGWYLALYWLGCMVSFEIGSTGREERTLERWSREREGGLQ